MSLNGDWVFKVDSLDKGVEEGWFRLDDALEMIIQRILGLDFGQGEVDMPAHSGQKIIEIVGDASS